MKGLVRRLVAVGCALTVIAVVAVASQPGPAGAAGPTDLLPDLVADPPTGVQLDYYSYPAGGQDLLLRFDGYIENAGAGPVEMNASRAASTDPMVPRQRIYRSDSTTRDEDMPGAQLAYSIADGHDHWHLQDAARYSLWTPDHGSEVKPSTKVGFCMGDEQHVDSSKGPSTAYYQAHGDTFCRHGQPDALSLVEGISQGWRDIYPAWLAFQWVVVSDVQPGQYALQQAVDPDGIVHESNESNAPAWSTSPVTIPGYVAQPVTGADGAYGQSQQITLAASEFGTPGARRFRVVSAPAHGHLDVAAGDDIAGDSVTYTPDPSYSGTDELTYEALDSTSPYPLHPQVATVSLSVAAPGQPSVAIDSAPSALETGHGVQLSATVTNDLPGVTWSADAGTITQGGFYTAPATVPAGGHVTVGARSASGAHDERTIAITAPAPPIGSPGTPETPHPRPGSLLSTIAAARQGRVLALSVIPAKSGVVYVKATAGRRHLGSCRAKQPAHRRFTCRANLRPGQSLGRMKVVARLYRRGKLVAKAHRDGAPVPVPAL